MADLSLKFLYYKFGLIFEGLLCWFGYFLVKLQDGWIIDFDIRQHQTIIFCTLFVFAGRIFLMFVDWEKKRIEIKQKQADLDNSLEDLRTKRLANNAEEERQKVEL